MFSHNSICRMFPMKILLSNVITVTKYKVFWAFFFSKTAFFCKKIAFWALLRECKIVTR